jgi:hypothetical protein
VIAAKPEGKPFNNCGVTSVPKLNGCSPSCIASSSQIAIGLGLGTTVVAVLKETVAILEQANLELAFT